MILKQNDALVYVSIYNREFLGVFAIESLDWFVVLHDLRFD